MKEAEKRQQEKWGRQEQQRTAEWEVFETWVKQNPVAAERLMLIIDYEQIKDSEHRAWRSEKRETDGPSVFDLSRLFNWLKAQRDLKKIGLDPHLLLRNRDDGD